MTKQKLLTKIIIKDHAGNVFGILCSAQKLESAKVTISCTSIATRGEWQNMKLEMITRKIIASLSSSFLLVSVSSAFRHSLLVFLKWDEHFKALEYKILSRLTSLKTMSNVLPQFVAYATLLLKVSYATQMQSGAPFQTKILNSPTISKHAFGSRKCQITRQLVLQSVECQLSYSL